jgi:hypothetical protein
MSYSSARALAGLASVGTLSLLAAVSFVYQLPSTFFPYTGGPLALDAFALLILYLAYAAVSFPFDVWAGYTLPCRHLHACVMFPVFLGRLVRGISLQGAVMVGSALALLVVGRMWGAGGALAAFALLLATLTGLQSRISRFLSGGAIASVPGRAWAMAIGWNLAGFALSVSLPWCGVTTVYSLVETLLGCTLWSLLGRWVLPRIDSGAAGPALFLSWAGFGLLSRAGSDAAGLPERWAGSTVA